MVSYKLTYFNVRGLGEISRYIFAAAAQEYEDNRIEFEDWPKLKANTTFGQLPLLEINDNGKITTLAQSNTIARYLARKFNLAGKDEIQRAKAEMILDHFSDLQTQFRLAFFESDEQEKEKKIKVFSEEKIPEFLAPVEKILKEQGTTHLAGNNPTIADLHLAVILDRFEIYLGSTLDKFPLVKALNDKIKNHSRIVAHKAKRPVTIL